MTKSVVHEATCTPRSTYLIVLFVESVVLTSALLSPHSLIESVGSLYRTPNYVNLICLPLPDVLLVNLLFLGSRNPIIHGLAP